MRRRSRTHLFRAALAALALVCAGGPLFARATPAPGLLSNPAQEARAERLQREFRCPVCQGESLDESNAPLAADLRKLIRQRVAAGDSDDQIRNFLVARYGDFILMQPPFQDSTYFLWLMPVVVLISGTAVATFVVAKARKRPD